LELEKLLPFPENKKMEETCKNFCLFNIRVYKSYEDLEKDFIGQTLHPGDLKPAVA
jgi:hypothetical protein